MRIDEAVSKIARHRFICDIAAMYIEAVGEVWIIQQCLAVPWFARAMTNGSVALESAKVEVRATAPGILATQ